MSEHDSQGALLNTFIQEHHDQNDDGTARDTTSRAGERKEPDLQKFSSHPKALTNYPDSLRASSFNRNQITQSPTLLA
ncbi:hypothetical protein FGIG_02767 [Fasciola gigantica]|uniref:Uncharacterized protein n=1 Tax=Fasciola gigantica TaxID=46835 RepID=A0A504YER0_FASGI|nr:hypothetical protein FGIG_02767 [Fasciola gigantica]